jgi:hypothetical protein
MVIVGENPEKKGFGRAGGEEDMEENGRKACRSHGRLA